MSITVEEYLDDVLTVKTRYIPHEILLYFLVFNLTDL